ncbi:PTS sugar transporter subunit IIA [Helcococcus bovis]|uniref:PTS sugar transporter subunit IIA n=1 Tax=Helcococcus bovis TaxID=3153252 RepID=UPI0038B8DC66
MLKLILPDGFLFFYFFVTYLLLPNNWETLDSSKVNLVISLLIPEKNNDEHLKILANISRKLMNEKNIELLKKSNSKEDILRVLSEI